MARIGGPDQARASLLQAMPLGPRAKVAIGVLALILASDIAAAIVDLDSISVADRLVDGERVSIGEARDIDDRLATVGIVHLVGFVLGAVSFLVWWSRAYKNAIAMGIPYPRYTTGWAVGWWFVPFANLVVPKNIANDIYRGSDPEMPYREPGFLQRPVSPLVHWWWGTWLASNFFDTFARPGDLSQNGAERYATQTKLSFAGNLLEIVAAVLAIAVVLEITRRNEERRRRFPDAIPGAIPPAPPQQWSQPAPPQQWGQSVPPPQWGQPAPPPPPASQPPPPPQ